MVKEDMSTFCGQLQTVETSASAVIVPHDAVQRGLRWHYESGATVALFSAFAKAVDKISNKRLMVDT